MFQIVLLTDRELKTEALLGRADCTVIERADAPTAKQVAVIWVQDDGEAPLINGTIYFLLIVVFWVCDKFSRHTKSFRHAKSYQHTRFFRHTKFYNFKFFIGISVHQNLFNLISCLRLLGSR